MPRYCCPSKHCWDLTDAATLAPGEVPSCPQCQKPGIKLPELPGYDMLRELGRGGMGVIYLAKHHKTRRYVALKMVHAGSNAGQQELLQIRSEALSAARLDHANIVTIYGVETHEDRLYVEMEYLSEGTLSERLDELRKNLQKAAKIVELLARATHHAHENKIVHRDMKPSNVLFKDDTPKITDFGLAKRLDASVQSSTGRILGTPAYMAPEQWRSDVNVDGRADIYALGVMLYEMLTPQRPFSVADRQALMNRVLNEEPMPPRRLNSKVPRDLETICLKCLEKEPNRRYANALALAEDLDRYLRHEPILARPLSPLGRLGRIGWRRRKSVAIACVLVATFWAVAVLWNNAQKLSNLQGTLRPRGEVWEVAHQNKRVEAHLLHQESIIDEIDHLSPKDAERARADLLKGLVDYIKDKRIPQPYLSREEAHSIKTDIALIAKRDPEAARFLDGLLAGRMRQWHATVPDPTQALLTNPEAFLPVPVKVVKDSLVRSDSASDSTVLTTIPCEGNVEITAKFASRHFSAAIALRLFAREWPKGPISGVLLPTDQTVITATRDRKAGNEVAAWDLTTGKLVSTYKADGPGDLHVALCANSGVMAVAVEAGTGQAPDGGGLKSGKDRSKVRAGVLLLDTVRLQVRGRLEPGEIGPIRCLMISPDGTLLAAGGGVWEQTGEIRLVDMKTGLERAQLRGHSDVIYCLAFSPDGKTLASGSRDHTVKLWDVATLRETATLRGHDQRVISLAYSPDGRTLASGGADGVGVWDCASAQRKAWLHHTTWNHAVAFSPDGLSLAVGSPHNVTLYAADGFERMATLPFPEGRFTGLAISNDSQTLVAAGKRGVTLWNLASRTERAVLREPGYIFQLGPAVQTKVQDPTVPFRIVREGITLMEQQVKESELLDHPVTLLAKREGSTLTFQLNELEPLIFRDNLSIAPLRPGRFGFDWPEGVNLQSVRCSIQLAADRPRSLELGDQAYTNGEFDDAFEYYRKQAIEAVGNRELSHECQYKQALCCISLNRGVEAADILKQLASAEGPLTADAGDWRWLAACQLWLQHVRRNDWRASRSALDDYILGNIAALHTLTAVARLVPEADSRRVLEEYGAATHHVHLVQPLPEHRRNLPQLVLIRDLFGKTHRSTAWSLFRTYRMIGDYPEARKLGEELLAADWGRTDRIHQIRLLEELSWLDRRELGDASLAMSTINRHLDDHSKEQELFWLLRLERARIHIAQQELGEAESELTELEALWKQLPPTDRPYRYYAGTCLVKGFLIENRKGRVEADRVWLEGLQNAGPGSFVSDVETELGQLGFVHGWILASLTGQLTQTEAEQLVAKFTKILPQGHPINSLKTILTHSVMLETWRSPRGREIARHLAFQTLSFEDYVRKLLIALAAEVLRQRALPADASLEHEDCLWEVAEVVVEAFFAGDIGLETGVSIALVWKEPDRLGQITIRFLPPKLRGPVAYAFGCRCLKDHNGKAARSLFEIAEKEAAAGSLTRNLAASELKKLQSQ